MDVRRMNSGLWENGPTPGEFYDFPGKKTTSEQDVLCQYTHGTQRAGGPITTGTSVVGVKFANGVIIAADNLVSYGSLARFTNCNRVMAVNDNTILGCGGDYADFQNLKGIIEQKIIDDIALDDKTQISPKSLFNYLTRFLYKKRSDFDPLYLDLVIGGVQNDEPFLGHVSIRGKAYEDNFIATGYGNHMALPILRQYEDQVKANNGSISKENALELTSKCMEVLYYRDCRSFPVYNYAMVSTEAKAEVFEKNKVDQNWSVSTMNSN